jgi:predicted transcriptional regulator
MPDEAGRTQPQRSERTEWIVLDLLLDAEAQRPWSIEEVVREIGKPVDVADALSALQAAGLIHRTADGFVFAARAAIRYSQIAE